MCCLKNPGSPRQQKEHEARIPGDQVPMTFGELPGSFAGPFSQGLTWPTIQKPGPLMDLACSGMGGNPQVLTLWPTIPVLIYYYYYLLLSPARGDFQVRCHLLSVPSQAGSLFLLVTKQRERHVHRWAINSTPTPSKIFSLPYIRSSHSGYPDTARVIYICDSEIIHCPGN